MYIKIFRLIYLIVIFLKHLQYNTMPYFDVSRLTEFSFNTNSFAYSLPDSVKTLLTELESCLEVTDALPDAGKEYNNNKRNVENDHHSAKYRNRYEFESPIIRSNAGGGVLKKKHDHLRNNKEHSSEWRTQSLMPSVPREDPVDSEWELMRSFKPTKIETKTGIEKNVNDIRIALNKISVANYEKQRDIVLNYVNEYFESKEDKTEAS